MKFTITSAFLALTFGTVCGGKINPQGEVEDEVFWERFMQTLDSMPAKATDAPTEASETPTAAPTYGEVSYAPTDGTGAPSDSPTPEGTSSGTTDCNSIGTFLVELVVSNFRKTILRFLIFLSVFYDFFQLLSCVAYQSSVPCAI